MARIAYYFVTSSYNCIFALFFKIDSDYNMVKEIYRCLFASVVLMLSFTSCADTYTISGTSLQTVLESNTAYLEYTKGSDMVKIDSCEIMHGKFSMSGTVDSVMCVMLNLGVCQLPVVIEKGDIKVNLQNSLMKVEGTPLNDKLYVFLNSRDSLTMQLAELPHRESELILSGVDHDEILRQLGEDEAELRVALDKLETKFITDNFNNVLGVTWFLQLCDLEYSKYGRPMTNSQIEEIYSLAPDDFRENPMIKNYMDSANK